MRRTLPKPVKFSDQEMVRLPVGGQDLPADQMEVLFQLYQRGTSENTLRAWQRDLIYITAWKRAAYGTDLDWPETESVALRFVLDHSADLESRAGSARRVAAALIGEGLRRSFGCPAPATLDRRIASWRAFHRMKNLPSPFDAPLVRQARGQARRAAAREIAPKSENPITRSVLENMLSSCDHSHRGSRDRAVLMLGFASGGRRRSEIAGLDREDVDDREFGRTGVIMLRLLSTKTTGPSRAPRLPLKGPAARAVMSWIGLAGIDEGPLFRPVSQSDRPLPRRLTADGIREIIRHRLVLAGYPAGFASPHGLRAGFLTQAALDGVPLAAAMQLSLHRSANQAQRYYRDVEIAENPATELLRAVSVPDNATPNV